jgi:glycosyltransferase involved in cell wall biosynthesis
LAVCVSSAGGLPEMVEHGVTGLVSPVQDFVTLSQHLQLLLAQDELRVAIGHNAKIWAQEHWSMENMIHRLLDVYSSLINV